MKSTVTISLDTDIINQIRQRNENISGLINELLDNYLLKNNPNKLEVLKESKEDILKQAKEIDNKLNQIKQEETAKEEVIKKQESEQEHYRRINDYISNMSEAEKQNYLIGIKEKRYRGLVEYVESRLN